MSNQTAAAIGAIANTINWERQGLNLQAIIKAGNQGRLGVPLTDWLVAQSWNLGKFVGKDKFVVDVSPKAKVKISGLGSNFENWHWNAIEDFSPATKPILVPFVLPEAMFDKDIIVKLGGVAKAISSLGEIFSLLEKQPEGLKSKTGQLLTDGRANIFYIPQKVTKIDANHFSYIDSNGTEVTENVKDPQYLFEINGQWFVLRAVCVRWYDGGWGVFACSVEYPGRWFDGDHAFSRNSVLKSSESLAPAQS